MNDPRVRWGNRFIELREDSSIDQKIKFGVLNKQRWTGYWNQGYLFLKTFAYQKNVKYADLGCNFEIFTMPGFLDLESLGPLTSIQPGQSLTQDEIWDCRECPELPEGEDELEKALQPFIDQLKLPDLPLGPCWQEARRIMN